MTHYVKTQRECPKCGNILASIVGDTELRVWKIYCEKCGYEERGD